MDEMPMPSEQDFSSWRPPEPPQPTVFEEWGKHSLLFDLSVVLVTILAALFGWVS